jgi:hypothetical protein
MSIRMSSVEPEVPVPSEWGFNIGEAKVVEGYVKSTQPKPINCYNNTEKIPTVTFFTVYCLVYQPPLMVSGTD